MAKKENNHELASPAKSKRSRIIKKGRNPETGKNSYFHDDPNMSSGEKTALNSICAILGDRYVEDPVLFQLVQRLTITASWFSTNRTPSPPTKTTALGEVQQATAEMKEEILLFMTQERKEASTCLAERLIQAIEENDGNLLIRIAKILDRLKKEVPADPNANEMLIAHNQLDTCLGRLPTIVELQDHSPRFKQMDPGQLSKQAKKLGLKFTDARLYNRMMKIKETLPHSICKVREGLHGYKAANDVLSLDDEKLRIWAKTFGFNFDPPGSVTPKRRRGLR